MSRSGLHNWECAIERLSGDNADKMLAIAQDIYNTAFVRGKNYMSLEQQPCEDCISRQAVFDQLNQAYNLIDAEHKIKKLKPVTLQVESDVSDKNVGNINCILDKIRAEIEASKWTNKDVRIERNALASGLDKALEIIDKYKTEREVNADANSN